MIRNHAPLTDSEEPSYSGAARYHDGFPGLWEAKPRIYVEFLPGNVSTSFLALLDTGGHYCILSQDVADLVEDQLTDPLGEDELRTAYGLVKGELYLLSIKLLAEVGEHLDLDAVVFIAPDWHGPSFLGYSGMLDRIRFAVDPHVNRFSFGRLP